MALSVTAPIQRAWDRMTVILFQPFVLSKWFGLGFCFFLANLGRGGGGGGGGFQPPMGGGGQGGTGSGSGQKNIEQVFQDAYAWVLQHLYQVLLVGAAILVFSFVLWLLLLWLRCRGIFMMIDGLALNRGHVKEPWRRYKEAGNSLFGFSVIVQIIATFLMLLSIGLAVWVAWPDITGQTFGIRALWGIIVLVVTLPLIGVNFLIVDMLLTDFIAPTMYIHDVRVRDAWRLWYQEIFKGHFWLLTLFYLMKMLLGLAVGMAAILATCVTCCIAIVPYIGTVILLPALVFMRCYTLYFLEQFGEPWRLFVYDSGKMPCVSCGYDLRGNPDALACPECGEMTPTGLEAQWVR